VNNNINRITEKAPFDLILRFKLEIRINIEAVMAEDSYSALKEVSVARREVKLKERDVSLV
jgi:hypothetical protein